MIKEMIPPEKVKLLIGVWSYEMDRFFGRRNYKVELSFLSEQKFQDLKNVIAIAFNNQV